MLWAGNVANAASAAFAAQNLANAQQHFAPHQFNVMRGAQYRAPATYTTANTLSEIN